MITIGEDYTLKREKHCWALSKKRVGKDKDGNPKVFWDTTYHATIQQVANWITTAGVEGVTEIKGLVKSFNYTAELLCKSIEEEVNS